MSELSGPKPTFDELLKQTTVDSEEFYDAMDSAGKTREEVLCSVLETQTAIKCGLTGLIENHLRSNQRGPTALKFDRVRVGFVREQEIVRVQNPPIDYPKPPETRLVVYYDAEEEGKTYRDSVYFPTTLRSEPDKHGILIPILDLRSVSYGSKPLTTADPGLIALFNKPPRPTLTRVTQR